MEAPVERLAGPRLDAVPKLSRLHWGMAVTFALAYFFEFADISSLTIVMPVITDLYRIDPLNVGLVLSSCSWGMIVGSLTSGLLCDMMGRQKVFLLTLCDFTFFTFIIPFTSSPFELMLVRICAGWGLAGMTVAITPYVNEFYPGRIRGRMTMLTFGVGGGLAQPGLAYLYLLVGIPFGWQTLFYFLGGMGVVILILYIFFVPESPRWLQVKGRWAEAEKTLSRIERGIPANLMEQYRKDVEEYSKRISTASTENQRMGLRELLGEEYRKRTCVLWVYFLVMNSGTWPLFMWLPTILIAGFGTTAGVQMVAIISWAGIISNLSMLPFAEKIGRKRMILIGLTVMSIFAMLMSQVLAFNTLLVTFGFLYSYFCGVQVSQGYSYCQELFPTQARATAFGIGSMLNRMATSTVPIVFGMMIAAGGFPPVFIVSGIFGLIAAADVAIGGISTKGKTLEELNS